METDKFSKVTVAIGNVVGRILFYILIVYMVVGYFTYGGFDGFFAMFILAVLFGLAVFLSMIPFAGIVIQYLASVWLVFPWVQSLTGIEPTWLTTLGLLVTLIPGFILWAISSWITWCIIKDHGW